VEIKTLCREPWETQSAIVTVPINNVPRGDAPIRIKIGWTVASGRILSNVIRCFRCYDIGHVAARYTVVEPGRMYCRRCVSSDHKMYECKNEPRCTLSVKYSRINVRHVTGTSVCPVIRMNRRESRLSGRSAVSKTLKNPTSKKII
jgi:hypothetical protein